MANNRKQKIEDVKMKCLCCGTANQASFYISHDTFNKTGRIPYCKDCIKNIIYPYYLEKYKTENIAVHHTLRSLNIPYIHDVYLSSVKGLQNPNSTLNIVQNDDKTAIIPAYFKNYNSMYTTNNYGNMYIDSIGLDNIVGLMTYDDIVKIKKEREAEERQNKLSQKTNTDCEIIEYDTDYLRHKFGEFPQEDLIFLEEEYLLWQDKLGNFIHDQSIRMNVIMLCIEYLKKRKKDANGENTKDEIATIQNIMRTSGLAEKASENEQSADCIGMKIDEIEQKRPIRPVDSKLNDVDGYRDIILGFAGATSRALGKENEFTKDFDRIMGKYSLDILDKVENDGTDS